MRYSIESLSDVMAAEVIGLDFSLPLDGETAAVLAQLRSGLAIPAVRSK